MHAARAAVPAQRLSFARRAADILPFRIHRHPLQDSLLAEMRIQPISEGEKAALFAAWDEWTRQGGQGEDRGEAVMRLKIWVDRNRPNRPLDLANLGLTSLPQLPSGVQEVYAFSNRIARLDVLLPDSIEVLHLAKNALTELPAPLPSGLRKLHLRFNQLSRLPDPLPETLDTLDVGDNELQALPQRPPARLVRCLVDNNPLPNKLPREWMVKPPIMHS